MFISKLGVSTNHIGDEKMKKQISEQRNIILFHFDADKLEIFLVLEPSKKASKCFNLIPLDFLIILLGMLI